MVATLTIEYETFDDIDVKALSVVDEENDEVLNVITGDEAEELYRRLLSVEEGSVIETYRKLSGVDIRVDIKKD